MSVANDTGIQSDSTPFVSSTFRLQFESAQDSWVLLYPEGMVKLNPTAAEILKRCNGERSVHEIVRDLEQAFDDQDLTTDVTQFLTIAKEQKWVDFK